MSRIKSYGERGCFAVGNDFWRCVKWIAGAFRNCYRILIQGKSRNVDGGVRRNAAEGISIGSTALWNIGERSVWSSRSRSPLAIFRSNGDFYCCVAAVLNCCCGSACRRGTGAAAIANVVGVSLDVSNLDGLEVGDCVGCKGIFVTVLCVGQCLSVNLCNGGVLVVSRIKSNGERGCVSVGNVLWRCVKRIAFAFRNCYRVLIQGKSRNGDGGVRRNAAEGVSIGSTALWNVGERSAWSFGSRGSLAIFRSNGELYSCSAEVIDFRCGSASLWNAVFEVVAYSVAVNTLVVNTERHAVGNAVVCISIGVAALSAAYAYPIRAVSNLIIDFRCLLRISCLLFYAEWEFVAVGYGMTSGTLYRKSGCRGRNGDGVSVKINAGRLNTFNISAIKCYAVFISISVESSGIIIYCSIIINNLNAGNRLSISLMKIYSNFCGLFNFNFLGTCNCCARNLNKNVAKRNLREFEPLNGFIKIIPCVINLSLEVSVRRTRYVNTVFDDWLCFIESYSICCPLARVVAGRVAPTILWNSSVIQAAKACRIEENYC